MKYFNRIIRFFASVDEEVLSSLFLFGIIVLITICFIAIYDFFNNHSKGRQYSNLYKCKYVYFWLPFILPIYWYALRYDVGTDYCNYMYIFNCMSEMNNIIEVYNSRIHSEFLYKLINYWSCCIDDYGISLWFIVASILFFFWGNSLYFFKNSIYCWVGVLFLLLDHFMYSTSCVRFLLAGSIILYSLRYIYNENFVRFCLCIGLSACFHKTALLCLGFYWLRDLNNKMNNYWRDVLMWISFFILPILAKTIVNFVTTQLPLFYCYSAFNNSEKESGLLLNFLLYMPILAICLFYKKNILRNNPKNVLLLNIFLYTVPFAFLGNNISVANRLSYYFSIVEIIIIPLLIKNIKGKLQKTMVLLFFIAYYFAMHVYIYIMPSRSFYPYKSICSFFW